MLNIRKNDEVVVIAGKDKGKSGKVLRVMPKKSRLVIEQINMAKKAQRPTQQNPQGGIVEVERSIHISNVMLLDKKTKKPTRFGIKEMKDGVKARISKKSGEVI